jgi:hypothetical protein
MMTLLKRAGLGAGMKQPIVGGVEGALRSAARTGAGRGREASPADDTVAASDTIDGERAIGRGNGGLGSPATSMGEAMADETGWTSDTGLEAERAGETNEGDE